MTIGPGVLNSQLIAFPTSRAEQAKADRNAITRTHIEQVGVGVNGNGRQSRIVNPSELTVEPEIDQLAAAFPQQAAVAAENRWPLIFLAFVGRLRLPIDRSSK